MKSSPEERILVVDDDPTICKILSRILETSFKVDTSTTIDQATEFLMKKEYGIVIIDYNLNDRVDGVEFASYVKSISSLSYIIMLTGNADFQVIKNALNEGNINKFLMKPFDQQDLLDIVDVAKSSVTSKLEVSSLLRSSDGIKMAQNLLTQFFDENLDIELSEFQLIGVVISRNSIPVFSKFIKTEYLKKFTDTIFSGFMTAINMVGREVFSDETNVNTLKFGEISIYFRFHGNYQFCYLIKHDQLGSIPYELELFDNFAEEIMVEINTNPKFFDPQNNHVALIEKKLKDLDEVIHP